YHIVHDAVLLDHVQHLPQGHMPCQEKYPHAVCLKHGQRIFRAGQGSEDLCVSDKVNIPCLKGLFVDRCSGHCVHLPGIGKLDAPGNVVIGRFSAHAADFSECKSIHVHIVQIDQVQDPLL